MCRSLDFALPSSQLRLDEERSCVRDRALINCCKPLEQCPRFWIERQSDVDLFACWR